MGQFKDFQIVLSKDTYVAGEILAGHVSVELSKPTEVHAINVKFKGNAIVTWTIGTGKDRETYFAKETYFKDNLTLLGGENGYHQHSLPRGQSTFPFQYQLPTDAPSSFFYPGATITYIIRCTISRKMSSDLKCHRIFRFINERQLDLNLIPEAGLPGESQSKKTLCCLCCASGPISAKLSVNRQGFVSGENVVINGEVDNQSNRTMKDSKVALEMGITMRAKSNTSYRSFSLSCIERDELPPGDTEVYRNIVLPIPQDCILSSSLDRCNIIDIDYFVTLSVTPSGPSARLLVPIKITMGSVPLDTTSYNAATTLS